MSDLIEKLEDEFPFEDVRPVAEDNGRYTLFVGHDIAREKSGCIKVSASGEVEIFYDAGQMWHPLGWLKAN